MGRTLSLPQIACRKAIALRSRIERRKNEPWLGLGANPSQGSFFLNFKNSGLVSWTLPDPETHFG